jgi:hypothetical protein
MIHQLESNLQGQASDIWIDSQEFIRLDVADVTFESNGCISVCRWSTNVWTLASGWIMLVKSVCTGLKYLRLLPR